MVRPRLVEEGKPIGYSKNNAATQDDEEHADLEMDVEGYHHHYHPHRHEQHTQAEERQTTSPSSSSLLRALGDTGGTGLLSRRHVTRVVIGGAAYDKTDVDSGRQVRDAQHEEEEEEKELVMMHDATLEMAYPHRPLNHSHDDTSTMQWGNTSVQPVPTSSFDAAQSQYLPQQQHPLHPQHQSQPTFGSYYQRHQLSHPEPTNFPFEPSSTTPSFSAPAIPSQPSHHPVVAHTTHIEIGANPDHDHHSSEVERMTGVEDHSVQPPLIVLDGANVAYAYAHASSSLSSSSASSNSTSTAYTNAATSKPVPDVRGIRVATDYFRSAGLRVLVVVPQSWLRLSSSNNNNNNNTLLDEDGILSRLQQDGHIVAAPARSDDDAFCLTICQRENARVIKNHHERSQQQRGPAYCLSNDLFRDAQARDATGQLQSWLEHGMNMNYTLYHLAPDGGYSTSSKSETLSETGPGRISFAFCDIGTMNDHGDREMDIVPNPRHPLVQWIEQHHLLQNHHQDHEKY